MSPEEVQCYVVESGCLLAGEYPGSWKHKLGARRLRYLVEKGVDTFIDLTTEEDRLEKYEPLLGDLGGGLKRLSFPIPDMGVPDSPETMRAIQKAIRDESVAGRTCYVHCWGGIGRTGTAVGCYLREQGLDGDAALERVQMLYAAGMPKVVRHPQSPQTRVQWDYVREWNA